MAKQSLEFYTPILLRVMPPRPGNVEINLNYFRNCLYSERNFFSSLYYVKSFSKKDKKFEKVSIFNEIETFLNRWKHIDSFQIYVDNISFWFPYIDLRTIELENYDQVNRTWLDSSYKIDGINYQLSNDLHPFAYTNASIDEYTFIPDILFTSLKKRIGEAEPVPTSVGFSNNPLDAPSLFIFDFSVILDLPVFDCVSSWSILDPAPPKVVSLSNFSFPLSKTAKFNAFRYLKNNLCFSDYYISPVAKYYLTTNSFAQVNDIKEAISNHIDIDFVNVTSVKEVNINYFSFSSPSCQDDMADNDFVFLLEDYLGKSPGLEDKFIYTGPCYAVKLSSSYPDLDNFLKNKIFCVATPEQYEKTMINMGRKDLSDSWKNKPDFIFITSSFCERLYGKDINNFPMVSPSTRKISFKLWILAILSQKLREYHIKYFDSFIYSRSRCKKTNVNSNFLDLVPKE